MDKSYIFAQNEVAGRIKAIRENLKMSQMQFAAYIGYSCDAISKIERCVRGVSGEMIAIISSRTGVSCDYILLGKLRDDISVDTRKQVHGLLKESIKLLELQ